MSDSTKLIEPDPFTGVEFNVCHQTKSVQVHAWDHGNGEPPEWLNQQSASMSFDDAKDVADWLYDAVKPMCPTCNGVQHLALDVADTTTVVDCPDCTPSPAMRSDQPVHTWFGLTYSAYLVLPRHRDAAALIAEANREKSEPLFIQQVGRAQRHKTESMEIATNREAIRQLRGAIDYALTVDDGLNWLEDWQRGDPEAMSELNDWLVSQP